jgi:hypothetical protein
VLRDATCGCAVDGVCWYLALVVVDELDWMGVWRAALFPQCSRTAPDRGLRSSALHVHYITPSHLATYLLVRALATRIHTQPSLEESLCVEYGASVTH